MLSRVCDLQKEIATFLCQNNLPYADQFFHRRWLAHLALLTDITTHLNALNVKLQGKDILVTDMHAHTTFFFSMDIISPDLDSFRLRGKAAIVGGAVYGEWYVGVFLSHNTPLHFLRYPRCCAHPRWTCRNCKKCSGVLCDRKMPMRIRGRCAG